MIEFIYTPILGNVKDIIECNDEMFAEKMLGDGVIIYPEDAYIVAPCDGKIDKVLDSKHAITMITNNGIELLIHVGIDTVELHGKYFKSFVNDHEIVKKGQNMLAVDFDGIKKEGYDISTMVVVLSKNTTLIKKNIEKNLSTYTEILEVNYK